MYLRRPVQPPVSALLVKAVTALTTIRGQTYVFAAGTIKVTFLHAV